MVLDKIRKLTSQQKIGIGLVLFLIDWATYNFTFDYSQVTLLGWAVYAVSAYFLYTGLYEYLG